MVDKFVVRNGYMALITFNLQVDCTISESTTPSYTASNAHYFDDNYN